jgi:4,5-DOPA dioxygenase extradiol
MNNTSDTMPVLFVSHGGGPLPLLGDPTHGEMLAAFQAIREHLPRPKAIVVISAHWEETQVAVNAGGHSSLLYDYYGFPQESYEINYPAPGDQTLAARVRQLLTDCDMATAQAENRGLDHGVFVPLKLLYPAADIPVVQISLASHLEPNWHIRLGQALQPLRDEGVMIIGSGFNFHNMSVLSRGSTKAQKSEAEAFTNWLDEVLIDSNLPEVARQEQLSNWEQAPGARFSHPREEHLLPIHVCYGAASAEVRQVFPFTIYGFDGRCYLW